MKRNGYTIAEAIITLAIIGVVAALTIPAFIANYRKQTYASSLSNAVANFENAMTTTIMQDGVAELFETKAWKADDDENFMKNLKLAYDAFSFSDDEYTIRLKNGTVYTLTIQDSDANAKTEVEVLNAGTNLVAKAGDLIIDVNGNSSPNTTGRDQFEYIVGNDGHLYPLYSKDWAVYTNGIYSEPKTQCVDEKDMDYCGAYLRLNGYKMDY